MLSVDIYLEFKKREKLFWYAIFSLIGIQIIVLIVFIFLFINLTNEKTKIIAYTESGIPKFVEHKDGSSYEYIEIQAFAKFFLEQLFTIAYSDLMGKTLQDYYIEKKLHYFFDKKYFNDFTNALVLSKLPDYLIERRIILLARVVDTIEVVYDPNTKTIYAKTNLEKTQKTAISEKKDIEGYVLYIKATKRTFENRWGLEVFKIMQQ